MIDDDSFFKLLPCYDALILGAVTFGVSFILLLSKDFKKFSKDVKVAKKLRTLGAIVYLLACFAFLLVLRERIVVVIFYSIFVTAFIIALSFALSRLIIESQKNKREKLSPFSSPDVK